MADLGMSGDTGRDVGPTRGTWRVILPDDEEVTAELTRLGPGRYALEELLGELLLSLYDLGEEVEYGTVIRVEEQADGSLRYRSVDDEDATQRLSGLVLPRGFLSSDVGSELSRRILDAGGNWEFLFGMVSAFVPPAEECGFDLEEEVSRSLGEWSRSSTE